MENLVAPPPIGVENLVYPPSGGGEFGLPPYWGGEFGLPPLAEVTPHFIFV